MAGGFRGDVVPGRSGNVRSGIIIGTSRNMVWRARPGGAVSGAIDRHVFLGRNNPFIHKYLPERRFSGRRRAFWARQFHVPFRINVTPETNLLVSNQQHPHLVTGERIGPGKTSQEKWPRWWERPTDDLVRGTGRMKRHRVSALIDDIGLCQMPSGSGHFGGCATLDRVHMMECRRISAGRVSDGIGQTI